jgi:hypothetical protein
MNDEELAKFPQSYTESEHDAALGRIAEDMAAEDIQEQWEVTGLDNGNEGLLIRSSVNPYGGSDHGQRNVCYMATPYGKQNPLGPLCHKLKYKRANLIAAAPDLLAAWLNFLTAWDSGKFDEPAAVLPYIKHARAAIAKATGKTDC